MDGYSTDDEAKKDPSTKILGDLYEVRKELEASYPPSRERSLAMTKLDEAALWIRATPLEVYEIFEEVYEIFEEGAD